MRSLDAGTRRELSKKVMAYKSSLQVLKKEYLKVKEKEDRKGLVGEKNYSSSEQLLEENQSRNDALTRAQRTVADTEEIAIGITEELGRNREKIENTKSKIHSVKGMTKNASKLISKMASRHKRQRILISVVFTFIAITFALIIYFGIFGNSSDNNKQ